MGAMRKNNMTSATAMREITKFTRVNSTFSRGKMSFSMRIFLIRGAESMMELIALLVESDMREKMVLPKMR